jgi:site-specific DNA-methyltransferase (adenine-specific)
MKVETWPIEKVTPYRRNPRKNDASVDAVALSLKEFGFRQPIVVDESGTVVVGHTRLKAAIKLGMKTVPVHVASGLTPAQARAYRIADNSAGSRSEWDFGALKEELAELPDFNVSDFGIDLQLMEDSKPIERPQGDAAGASPWDRVGDASDGIMFSFGTVQRRLPQELFEAFSQSVDPDKLEEWLRESIRH